MQWLRSKWDRKMGQPAAKPEVMSDNARSQELSSCESQMEV